MSDSESDSDMDVENERFSSSDKETGGSDDDSDREDGFLNIPLDAHLRALLEDEGVDNDEVFYGLAEPVPEVPDDDWQDTERIQCIVPYDRQAGPTFNEPPGAGKPSDYFSLLLEDRFL